MDATLIDYALILLVVVLVLCPAKYDPAIRLKDWSLKKAKRER